MNNRNLPGMGLIIPDWMYGLNPASLATINKATEHLKSCTDPKEIEMLESLIDALKNKRLILTTELSTEKLLQRYNEIINSKNP